LSKAQNDKLTADFRRSVLAAYATNLLNRPKRYEELEGGMAIDSKPELMGFLACPKAPAYSGPKNSQTGDLKRSYLYRSFRKID
jgi:hypothetical protein